MRRPQLTLAVFRELCRVQKPAFGWYKALSVTFAAVLQDTPSVERLANQSPRSTVCSERLCACVRVLGRVCCVVCVGGVRGCVCVSLCVCVCVCV